MKIRSLVLVSMIILMALASCAGPVSTPLSTATSIATPMVNQSYINSYYGFNINYPEGWSKAEESPQDAQDTSNYGNSHIPVQFQAPKTEPNKPECNVSVTIFELSQMTQTFDAWSQGVISANSGSYSHIIESSTTFLSSYPAYHITYTDDLQKIESIRVWASANGKIYNIDGTVFQPAQFSDYLPTIQQMIDSFKITSVTTPISAPTHAAPTEAPTPNPLSQHQALLISWPQTASLEVVNGDTWYGFKIVVYNDSTSYVGEFTDNYTLGGHYGLGPIGPGINLASFDFLDPKWVASQSNIPQFGGTISFPHSVIEEPRLTDDVVPHELDLGSYSHFNLDPTGTWKLSIAAKLTPNGAYEDINLTSFPANLTIVLYSSLTINK